jgi:hypothetical protein
LYGLQGLYGSLNQTEGEGFVQVSTQKRADPESGSREQRTTKSHQKLASLSQVKPQMHNGTTKVNVVNVVKGIW